MKKPAGAQSAAKFHPMNRVSFFVKFVEASYLLLYSVATNVLLEDYLDLASHAHSVSSNPKASDINSQ